jgi:hypothetical protein
MIERATMSEKVLVLLLMIFSASGFSWLALVPPAPPMSHLLSRLGFVAAFPLPLAGDGLLDTLLCLSG